MRSLLLLTLCLILLPVQTQSQDIGVRAGSSQKVKKRTPRRYKPVKFFTITITSDPYECEIYLNDVYRGTTSLQSGRLVIPNLDPRVSYTLRVYKRGLGDDVQQLKIKTDSELKVSLPPKAQE